MLYQFYLNNHNVEQDNIEAREVLMLVQLRHFLEIQKSKVKDIQAMNLMKLYQKILQTFHIYLNY